MLKKYKKDLSKSRCSKYRRKILDLSQKVTALHIGGSFSCVEIIDCIYNELLKNKTDKFILSKGHTGIIQYVLLNDKKKITDQQLQNYCKSNGILGVHPDYGVPGIETSTGSLGHGLGVGAGLALGKGSKSTIYILVSDGELMEGSVWEMVLTISSLKINNIVLIVDNNDLQSATRATDTHPTLYPLDKKFKSFGWETTICNGHSSKDLKSKILKRSKKKPFVLIAKTIKGYPVSFMKDVPHWHYRSPTKNEYLQAIKEI